MRPSIILPTLLVSLFLLIPCFASIDEEEPHDLLVQADRLVQHALAESDRSQAVEEYDEPLRLLNQLTERYPSAKETCIEATRLKVVCYEQQGRYADKHRTLKELADLSANGNPEVSAGILEVEADSLMSDQEISEGLLLYRMIAREYPDAGTAPEVLLKAAKHEEGEFKKHGFLQRVMDDYRDLVGRYPDSRASEEARMALADLCWRRGERQEAVQVLTELNERFPKSRLNADALFQLGLRYAELGNSERARANLAAYVERYPNGRQAKTAKLLLGIYVQNK